MNIRTKLKPGYSFFSTNQLIRLTSQKIFLPFFHTVSDESIPHISNIYALRNTRQFEKDMDYLCRYFAPVTIEKLSSIVYENKKITKPVFHLTFDDGLSELYSVVAPILERKGIPATIFINTGFIDNKALFYRYKISLMVEKLKLSAGKDFDKIAELLNSPFNDITHIKGQLLKLNCHQSLLITSLAKILEIDFDTYLSEKQPYLSTPQVNDLIKRGFEIGSHSETHPLFEDVNETEQKNQVSKSFSFLSKQFNRPHRYFSFPFSDSGVKSSFLKWLYEEQNCRLSFGISGLKQDISPYHLHRIPFEDSMQEAKDIVKAEYFYYILKSFVGRNVISRH